MSNPSNYVPTDMDLDLDLDYLDEIGYDLEDDYDDGDNDPLEGRGFQPWTGDTPEDDSEDDILAEFGF
jgi:hypothetical protein